MNNPPAKLPEPVDRLLERVIIGGDLSGLTPLEKTKHYIRVCRDIGLYPSTQPFAYLKLQGKETLYALKGCTDQLRRLRNVSIEILSQGLTDDLYSVHVQARDATGRQDEDLGVVPLPANVKGEFRANMILKAVTKAKRRVTLSFCGLGFPDESEVESIPDAKTEPPPTLQELSMAEEMGDEIPDHELLEAKEHADAARGTTVASAAAAADKEPASPPASAAAVKEPGVNVNPFGVNVPAPRDELTLMWEGACEAADHGADATRAYYRRQKPAHQKYMESRLAELRKRYPPITGE
jgi:hypothetical protein